jgi:hypothetical protein
MIEKRTEAEWRSSRVPIGRGWRAYLVISGWVLITIWSPTQLLPAASYRTGFGHLGKYLTGYSGVQEYAPLPPTDGEKFKKENEKTGEKFERKEVKN